LRVKYIFIFILQLFVLWLINELGLLIVQWLHLPIPGNVFGMILLFILLVTGVFKLEWVNEASSFLIKHLVFFFIPITVGMMTLGTILLQNGLSLIVILIVSAVIGMVVTSGMAQLLGKKREVSKE